jgi:hypothetical protein
MTSHCKPLRLALDKGRIIEGGQRKWLLLLAIFSLSINLAKVAHDLEDIVHNAANQLPFLARIFHTKTATSEKNGMSTALQRKKWSVTYVRGSCPFFSLRLVSIRFFHSRDVLI